MRTVVTVSQAEGHTSQGIAALLLALQLYCAFALPCSCVTMYTYMG